MKWTYLSVSVMCACINITYGGQYNFTFTYEMARLCNEYLCQHGYRYDTYFKVNSEDRRVIKKDPDVVLEMHIAILAASNGHILLSSVPKPEATDPVYEIVVGGGGNKFTELRRNLRRNGKISTKSIGILSAIEFRAFYIRISQDGTIEFGRENDTLPILSYFDVNPLSIQYFSFAAWNGVEAKFLYDCPLPGETKLQPNSQEVEPKLSNSDQLKRTLLLDRDPSIPPMSKMNVKLGVKVTSVKYNAFDAKLTTGVAMVMSWTDDNMAWDPSKFNGVEKLKFRQGQIWQPTFFAYNSDELGAIAASQELISMVNSGEATFHCQTKLYTWCVDYSTALNKWPRDEYQCTIVIKPWEVHETFTIEELDEEDMKMKIFEDLDEFIANDWDIKITKSVVSPSTWNKMYTRDNQTQSDQLVIVLELWRRATSYNIVFYTPLLVLVMFVLLSFWTDALTMTRVWFYITIVILISAGLCYIDYLMPCHTTPSILILYITVLMGVLIALLTQVIQMTKTAESFCKTWPVQSVLTKKGFRSIFCLPPMKTCNIYDTIMEGTSQDDYDYTTLPRNVEELQTENTKYGEKEELAIVLDKFMFFIYSIVFSVMLALHF